MLVKAADLLHEFVRIKRIGWVICIIFKQHNCSLLADCVCENTSFHKSKETTILHSNSEKMKGSKSCSHLEARNIVGLDDFSLRCLAKAKNFASRV